MYLETFYTKLDQHSGSDKLKFMIKSKHNGYRYQNDYQPDHIIWRFYDCNTDPIEIANTMIECFGKNIKCRKISYTYERSFTILGALDMELLDAINSNDKKMIKRIKDLITALHLVGA